MRMRSATTTTLMMIIISANSSTTIKRLRRVAAEVDGGGGGGSGDGSGDGRHNREERLWKKLAKHFVWRRELYLNWSRADLFGRIDLLLTVQASG